MSQDRLQMLLAIHNELVRAAGLPEGARPYSISSHLAEVEKQIMEEIKTKPTATTTDDDIPF